MTGRPCKPDADLKGLWRTLLGTSFPACGISEDSQTQSGHTDSARKDVNGRDQLSHDGPRES
jgi:hypothetical protein